MIDPLCNQAEFPCSSLAHSVDLSLTFSPRPLKVALKAGELVQASSLSTKYLVGLLAGPTKNESTAAKSLLYVKIGAPWARRLKRELP
jgi:hypothetical protein